MPNDPRLAMLREKEEFLYVAFGYPGSEDHPYVETDNDRAIGVEVDLLRRIGCRTFGHIGFAEDDSIVPGQRRASVLKAVGRQVPHESIHYADTGDAETATIARIASWIEATPNSTQLFATATRLHTSFTWRAVVQDDR